MKKTRKNKKDSKIVLTDLEKYEILSVHTTYNTVHIKIDNKPTYQ